MQNLSNRELRRIGADVKFHNFYKKNLYNRANCKSVQLYGLLIYLSFNIMHYISFKHS